MMHALTLVVVVVVVFVVAVVVVPTVYGRDVDVWYVRTARSLLRG